MEYFSPSTWLTIHWVIFLFQLVLLFSRRRDSAPQIGVTIFGDDKILLGKNTKVIGTDGLTYITTKAVYIRQGIEAMELKPLPGLDLEIDPLERYEPATLTTGGKNV